MTTVPAQSQLLLTDELRQKTKGLHAKTDRLIYRQIILGFYYVFSTFEEEYDRHLKDPNAHPWLKHTYSPDLKRSEAFEADLAYYYGPDFKQHIRPSKQVQAYIDHIRDISRRHPERLIAYPATLYLGLFFGGQITRSKIVKATNFFPTPPDKQLGGEHDSGIAIFTFREKPSNHEEVVEQEGATPAAAATGKKLDPNKIKTDLKARLNSIPGINDDSETAQAARRAIGEEAQEIFARNMDLMTSTQGMARVWIRWITFGLIYLFAGLAVFVAFYQILSMEPAKESVSF
ncbi:hypothetical protein BGZ70_009885 [Mortierella alpina]|uniref:Heme oxygenase-like protein n=1 Tax=Mortierella alpina TaxID=64518 RepID=A0A9P6JDE2_MORAP|nr:hypothetical protein BGZ70_009885 [Mortierella alpina]